MHTRMRYPSLFTAVATIFAIGLGATAFAQGQGTWKLNVAKSTYHKGQAPKSTTLIYEAAGEGVKVTVEPNLATSRCWVARSRLSSSVWRRARAVIASSSRRRPWL